MGDVTLHLLLDGRLLTNAITVDDDNILYKDAASSSSSSSSSTASSFEFLSTSHVLPADASLAELMQIILTKLGDYAVDSTTSTMSCTPSDNFNNNSTINNPIESPVLDNLTIIDASYHPAKVITPIFRQYSQISGPNSQTLMSMGWYPSGKLVILSLPRIKPASSTLSTSDTAQVASEFSASVGNSPNRDAEEEQLLNRFIEWHHRFVLQHEEGAYNDPTAASNNYLSGQKSTGSAASVGVQWTGIGAVSSSNSSSQPLRNGQPATATTLKPSQIFQAIEQRSISDVPSATNKTNTNIQKKKSRSRRTELERSERLNSLLQKLDTDNKKMKKNRGVSQKVRSMLLKSNSLGDKKLRMEDRFHLEVVYLSDLEAKSSYRFYSRQTTAGKVASSLAPNLGKDMAVELLVSYPPPPRKDSGGGGAHQQQHSQERPEQPNGVRRYRRLPNTMTLHDAQCAGWIQEFDVVVVRAFNILIGGTNDGGGEGQEKYGSSKSVLDSDSDDDEGDDDDDEDRMENDDGGSAEDNDAHEQGCSQQMAVDNDNNDSQHSIPTNHSQEQPKRKSDQQDEEALQQRLHILFQSFNGNSNIPKTKAKKKLMSKQVRTMLIKSKSVGNARIKQEDRIYLEVIFFRDSGGTDAAASNAVAATIEDVPHAALSYSSSYRYFSKQTDLRQIIGVVCKSSSDDNGNGCAAETIEFIVPHRTSEKEEDEVVVYQSLDESMTLGDAMLRGYIDNFGLVVLRACS
ncbi:hypothetical protein ACHAWU_002660 [Discostella pseudostelligera]|uniref:Uncharacterized protein n=1 Tax=Discostella pseudostelligera TaxID=259834 RepID=A0ABD3MYV2_9STRA